MNPPDWNQIVLETTRRAELIFAEQMHSCVISKSQLWDIVSREAQMTFTNQQQKYALFQQTQQQVPMEVVSDPTSSMPNDVVDTVSHTCVPDVSIPSAECSVAENVPMLSNSCNEIPLCSPASPVSPYVMEPVTDLILEQLPVETMSNPSLILHPSLSVLPTSTVLSLVPSPTIPAPILPPTVAVIQPTRKFTRESLSRILPIVLPDARSHELYQSLCSYSSNLQTCSQAPANSTFLSALESMLPETKRAVTQTLLSYSPEEKNFPLSGMLSLGAWQLPFESAASAATRLQPYHVHQARIQDPEKMATTELLHFEQSQHLLSRFVALELRLFDVVYRKQCDTPMEIQVMISRLALRAAEDDLQLQLQRCPSSVSSLASKSTDIPTTTHGRGLPTSPTAMQLYSNIEKPYSEKSPDDASQGPLSIEPLNKKPRRAEKSSAVPKAPRVPKPLSSKKPKASAAARSQTLSVQSSVSAAPPILTHPETNDPSPRVTLNASTTSTAVVPPLKVATPAPETVSIPLTELYQKCLLIQRAMTMLQHERGLSAQEQHQLTSVEAALVQLQRLLAQNQENGDMIISAGKETGQ